MKFAILFFFFASPLFAQYTVEVQVVDLQVSVQDKHGNYIAHLKAEDFEVRENGALQQVLDLDQTRQPFSIGILIDTSSSMQSAGRIISKTTEDFISAMNPEDEYFLMVFADQIVLQQEMQFAKKHMVKLDSLKYGQHTKLFDAMVQSMEMLKGARYPRHAIFVISDGINTYGSADEKKVRELAQASKTIIYSLIVQTSDYEFNPLRSLAEDTGGTWFKMYEQWPRMEAAYEKIATDLSHRFTLYYKSASDYTKALKPAIQVKMKNPDWRVQYQKAYYPGS